MNAQTMTYDEGLRAYLISVYNHMFAGLVTTGLFAWLGSVMFPSVLTNGWLATGLAFMPLAFLILLLVGLNAFSPVVAGFLFYLYAASVGISFSAIMLIYTIESIFQAFFIAASVFAAASIYGYTTKSDLTGIGSILFIALIGLVVASIVNIFLASSAFAWFVSVAAVVIFTGLTAYDTQVLKEEYYSNGSRYGYSTREASSIHGALTMYLNFINLFIHILMLLGNKKN